MSAQETLLLVCTANVCRSPFASVVAQRMFGTSARIISAGVEARPGLPMCDIAARCAADMPGGPEFARSHRSVQLTAETVAASALVLCATVAQCEAVGRLDPRARRRTFTLLQAQQILSRSRGQKMFPGERLEAVAARLDAARWTVAIEEAGRVPWWRRRAQAPVHDGRLSLLDWHQGQTSAHISVLDAVIGAVSAFDVTEKSSS